MVTFFVANVDHPIGGPASRGCCSRAVGSSVYPSLLSLALLSCFRSNLARHWGTAPLPQRFTPPRLSILQPLSPMVVLGVTCATRIVQYYSFSPWTFEDLAPPLLGLPLLSFFFFSSCLLFRLVLSTCGSLFFFFFFLDS